VKIVVEDFQSLGSVALDVPRGGLTVVVGPSNLGKSALVRGVTAALFNRPGEEFVRKGKRRALVQLDDVPTLSGEPLSVVWEKGHNLNKFTINGEVFKKVGAKAPQGLVDAGFRDVFIGDKERSRGENIRPQMSDQFDRLFLLEKAGSFISDVLSVVSRLGVLLHASGRCASDLRSAKQLLGVRRNDLADAEAAVQQVAGIEAALARIAALRAEIKAANEVSVRLHSLKVWSALRQSFLPVTSLAPAESVSAESLGVVLDRGSRLQAVTQLATQRSALTPLAGLPLPAGDAPVPQAERDVARLVRIAVLSARREHVAPVTKMALPAVVERPNLSETLARIVEVSLLRVYRMQEQSVAGLQMIDPTPVDVPALRATLDRCERARDAVWRRAMAAVVAGRELPAAVPVPQFETLGGIRMRVAQLTGLSAERTGQIEALHSAKARYNGAESLTVEAQAALEAFKAEHPACPVCGNSWIGASA
jgi:hypothetical protein